MQDGFGRKIDYLRISVTDRCNFRCQYCMSEKMSFMPKAQLLTLEEISLIAERFIGHGIRKIRLTGGEPLVRRDMKDVIQRLGRSRPLFRDHSRCRCERRARWHQGGDGSGHPGQDQHGRAARFQ